MIKGEFHIDTSQSAKDLFARIKDEMDHPEKYPPRFPLAGPGPLDSEPDPKPVTVTLTFNSNSNSWEMRQ
jgi:hypothetical protein